MAVRTLDRLQEIFPDWPIDDRATTWLWLVIQDEINSPKERKNMFGGTAYLFKDCDFGTSRTREYIARHIDRERSLIDKIEARKSHSMVHEEELKWIEKNGRQVDFLLRKHSEIADRENRVHYPENLTKRQKLIASIDYPNESISKKKSYLRRLKKSWVQQQTDDSLFKWYIVGGKEKEKEKCEVAWIWYQKNHNQHACDVEKFEKQEDVLSFLDSTNFTLDSKLLHLEQIKKKHKSLQTKVNRQGKIQTNLSLSEEARRQLDDLAKEKSKTKTDVVEELISQAHKELST